jgi:4-hydroxy-tetrahydrodipicolinate synthase
MMRWTGKLGSITGVVTATPTPLRPDGTIDHASVRDLARHLVASGAAGLAPIGGTGEHTALTAAQRADMVAHTVEAVAGAVPVIAGVLSPGLGDTIAGGRDALAAGADALMIVTPYYSRPVQDGIIDYYKRVSDTLDADLMLYEIPYRTGIALTPDTIARMTGTTRIVAMKACNQDLSQQMRVIQAAGDEIAVLSGEEDVFPLHVAMGARGGVLATSCLFQSLWNRIFADARVGALERALRLHADLRPVIDLLFAEHNPAPLKAALAQLGRPAGDVLPPLRPASGGLRARLAELLPKMMELEARAAHSAAA